MRMTKTPILYLDRKDLNVKGREKKFEDVGVCDIADALKPFQRADMVFFVEDGLVRILESRYVIVQ